MLGFQLHKGCELSQFMSAYKVVVVELFVRLKNVSDGRLNHVKHIHRSRKKSRKSIFLLIFHAVQITYFKIYDWAPFLPLENNTLKKISTLLLKYVNHDAVFFGWELTGDTSRAFIFKKFFFLLFYFYSQLAGLVL